MEKIRKKKTTKKSLGMKPIPKKPLTKRQKAIEYSNMMKELEMTKPIDTELDDFYRGIQMHKKEIDRLYKLIMDFAPKSLKDGNRFESFIYIAESWITDKSKLESIYKKYELTIPVKTVIDQTAAVEDLEAFEIDVPKKRKVAHLRGMEKK